MALNRISKHHCQMTQSEGAHEDAQIEVVTSQKVKKVHNYVNRDEEIGREVKPSNRKGVGGTLDEKGISRLPRVRF